MKYPYRFVFVLVTSAIMIAATFCFAGEQGNPPLAAQDDLLGKLYQAISARRKDDALEVLARFKNGDVSEAEKLGALLDIAIARGMPEVVTVLLKKGVDPLAKDKLGVPFLYNSIQAAYSVEPGLTTEVIECVHLVLEEAKRLGRLSSFHPDASLAFRNADKPNLELLKMFLKYGADPSQPGPYAYFGMPLDTAIAKDNLDAVRIIIEQGSRINQQYLDEKAFEALRNHKTDLLAIFRSAGADSKRYINANPKILFDAAGPQGSIETLDFLLKNGADPNAVEHTGSKRTPIFAVGFDPEKIKLLLSYGADPNIKDGYTILANILFYHGDKISVPSSIAGQPPRVYNKVLLVKLLLDHGSNLNANNGGQGEWGALGLAEREDKDVIDFLVKRGATLRYELGGPTLFPVVEEKYGKSVSDSAPGPITIAVDILGRDDLALALIARDRKVDPKDKRALMEAVRRGWRNVAEALLRAGADPNVADAKGIAPLAMAERRRDEKLIKTLIANGAKPSTKPIPRYTLDTGTVFDKGAAEEIDDIIFLDPPRFTLSSPVKASFVLYGKQFQEHGQNFDEIKCEQSAAFQIIANSNFAGGISVGVCGKETGRLSDSVQASKRYLDVLMEQLSKGGNLQSHREDLDKLGLVYERKTDSNRSEIYYFPMIVFGHGIFVSPTAIIVSAKQDRAAIVQVDVMNLCDVGRSMQSQTVLCSDTKNAIIEIARRLFTRFAQGAGNASRRDALDKVHLAVSIDAILKEGSH